MEVAANQLLDILNAQNGMRTQCNLNVLESSISSYMKFLPRPITFTSYTEINNRDTNDGFLYGRIVTELFKLLNDTHSLLDEHSRNLIHRLLVLDGCTAAMLHELLEAVDDCLQKINNNRTIRIIIMILEKILKSDAVYSAIVYASKGDTMDPVAEEETFHDWRRFLQALIALPSRIANKMKGKIGHIFTPEVYAKVITYHVIRAISFVDDVFYKVSIEPKYKIFSTMISKMVVSFGADKLVDFIEILVGLAQYDKKCLRYSVYNILVHTEGLSTEKIAVLLLKTIKSPSDVAKLFRDLVKTNHWKHVLTKKIPLLSYYNDDSLIVNLIHYLGSPEYGERTLNELLVSLLDIWGDRSALNHTSMEQHEYITKLILLSVKNLKETLKQTDKDIIQRLLFEGTAAHLESMQLEIRAIGMITGELIVGFLNESSDGPKLLYEYDSMPMTGLQTIEKLKTFVNNTYDHNSKNDINQADDSLDGDGMFRNDTERKIQKLAVDCSIASNDRGDHTRTSDGEPSVIDNFVKQKSTDDKAFVHDQGNDDIDLDSDDDLIPYDLSNDTKVTDRLRPIYLRDLKENLLNVEANKDQDVFSESLQVAEELIMSQLPNDDASLAIQLLEIFISLQEVVYVENFEFLKFQSCVAIITIYPERCAEYLCSEFHAEIGQHSVNVRIFILNILGEASRRLSKINVDEYIDSEVDHDGGRTKEMKRPEKSISLFIDVHGGKKYETLYDEDFEVPVTNHGDARNTWIEIVQRRIQSNTKIFAHKSKRPSKTINKFNGVVSSFFYPLLYGLSQKGACLHKLPKSYADQENILLIHFLKTLSTLMVSAENCAVAPKIGLEILELAWILRYHEQANIRLCVIQNIASVIVSLSNECFTTEIIELLLEFRTWLCDSCRDFVKGDPDTKCRNLGENVVALIDLVINSTFNNG